MQQDSFKLIFLLYIPVIYFKMNLLICIINYMPCFYELKLILPFSQLYFFIIGRHNIFIFIYI